METSKDLIVTGGKKYSNPGRFLEVCLWVKPGCIQTFVKWMMIMMPTYLRRLR